MLKLTKYMKKILKFMIPKIAITRLNRFIYSILNLFKDTNVNIIF